MNILKHLIVSTLLLFSSFSMLQAEDGYELWLRYHQLKGNTTAANILAQVYIPEGHPTYDVIRQELSLVDQAVGGASVQFVEEGGLSTSLLIGKYDDLKEESTPEMEKTLQTLGEEGYLIDYISGDKKQIVVVSNQSVGALYGSFHLLRLLMSGADLATLLPIAESPKITHRVLNHWDNLDRTVERGYSGFSIWDWHRLPKYIDQRYIDYARANASVGINGTVLTNVNSKALVLAPTFIEKVKTLAEVFRPYGLKVYLTARFSAPIELGGLKTADPLDEDVQSWWKDKAKEIYAAIPDFGGFVVKANSEGQPGPQNYGRNHADGANMLADAVAPYGGIVMWRAFVYSHEVNEDRAKQANNEFEPLDGQFRQNVFVQVKNGAIDFQPREPFHPLFGAMQKTKLALELQITQEYLGQGTNLVYLAPLFKECLDAQTFRPDKSSTVASVIDGSDYAQNTSAIAGVSNIGNNRNWAGHLFGQSNWYAFGRLAWDHQLGSEVIAEEWISQTFGNDQKVKHVISGMMLSSREIFVNYTTPLGLHHIMGWDHHYGPGPWVEGSRPDWSAPYYHQADAQGIGFNRTATGSDALSQYALEIQQLWSNTESCPEKYLLWFHHLPWTYTMKSENSLWEALCFKYDSGVKSIKSMKESWSELSNEIDQGRFNQVSMLLDIQEDEAEWWRNSCLLYFQTLSNMRFPKDIEQPQGNLEYYKSLKFPFAPGISPKW